MFLPFLVDVWLLVLLIYGHGGQVEGTGKAASTTTSKLEENERFPSKLVPESPQDDYGRLDLTQTQQPSKVEHLGSILKRCVARLRNHPHQEVDLVFLVDSSASVGAENFYNEIKFIKKLLADFTVSFNTTRVVVVTYSSKDQVIRQVDHISSPSPHFQKCFLLDEEIPAISYNSGGTYTLGALEQALDVLQHARAYSTKAVFLITDGYSNGGDPRPTADLLKRLGVTLFTFGIRNGNVKELLAMASEPKAEHCFVLDSFQEFEALARRALHEDLSVGAYEPEPHTACSKLCGWDDLSKVPLSAGFCCDPRAICVCGTHTGQHSCLCPPGYFGRGIQQGGCQACPEGTFKAHVGPGERETCQECPLPHQTSPLASTSHEQCSCQPGFHMSDGKCQSLDCPPLYPPANGHFIRDQCINVFNSVCGIRCNSGFQLQGSAMRTCLRNATWSGTETRCLVKSCRPLSAPRNGHIQCSTTTIPNALRHGHEVDTECLFSCQVGFRLVGSRRRSCLPNTLWTGLPGTCQPITCPLLRRPNHGEIYPPECRQHKMRFGQRCAYSCHAGFQVQGPALRECVMPGLWSGSRHVTRCVDVTPPMIDCPHDQEVEADMDRHYAVVHLEMPQSNDNSGLVPNVLSSPVLVPGQPMKLKIGVTTIRISASDLSGNRAKCVFRVTVKDTQAPTVDFCRSPPPFLAQPGVGYADDIEWDEPIFHDNSLRPLRVNQTKEFGRYMLGTTKVIYSALDEAGNKAVCELDISVQEDFCQSPPDPIHGHKNCSDSIDRVICSLSCHHGYAFALNPDTPYFCEKYNTVKEVWLPKTNPHPFPECSIISHSRLLVTPGQVSFNVLQKKKKQQPHHRQQEMELEHGASSVCSDQFFLSQVTNHVKVRIRQRLAELCKDHLTCDISDLEAICEEVQLEEMIATNKIFRRRRDLSGNTSLGSKKSLSPLTDTDFPLNRSKRRFPRHDQDQNHGWEGENQRDPAKYQDFEPVLHEDKRQMIRVDFILTGKSTLEMDNGTSWTSIVEEFISNLHQAQNNLEQASEMGHLDLHMGGKLLISEGLIFRTSHFDCSPGTVKRGNMCVNCPVGSYFNVMSKNCEPCPSGSYQPEEAQLTCLVCPGQRSTLIQGATSSQDCKAQCLPGTYSVDGLAPCTTCSFGRFQPLYAQYECLSCPEGFGTENRGSRLPQDCLDLCTLGEVSETGLSPCFPCPKGYFQPFPGQTGCIQCPKDNCQIGQMISPTILRSLPRLEVNDCFSQPCLNGATCLALEVGFQCQCPPGFKGLFCEAPNDLCASNPCLNGGFCSMDFSRGDYECSCPDGFGGTDCETNEDECISNPCQNGATCVDGINEFTCICLDGFQGETCENNIDDCLPESCLNGGHCIDDIDSFSCQCSPGFRGPYCEDNVDKCTPNPCLNGGTCLDGLQGYKCLCSNGFRGPNCEQTNDACNPELCMNNGWCEIGRDACFCQFGFAGKFCDQELRRNFSLVMGNHSTIENLDYVRIHRAVPDLTEFSFCFWMRSEDQDSYGTPLSYAIATQDNEITFTDYSGFVLAIKGDKVVTDVTANDGNWHALCVWWESRNGIWGIAKDGHHVDGGNGLATNKTIQGNGVLILGQEQDYLAGNFSTLESFHGELTAFDFWPKVRQLSTSDLWPEVPKCQRTSETLDTTNSPEDVDKVFDWTDVLADMKGMIVVQPLDLCVPCPDLSNTSLPNASLTLVRSGRFQQIQITCDSGFILENDDDDGTRTCTPMGQWTGKHTQMPQCREINCGYPGYITNGFIVGSSFGYLDTISYACRPGFALKGSSEKVCQSNEQWEPPGKPTCQVLGCSLDKKVLTERHLVIRSGPKWAVLDDQSSIEVQIGGQIALECGLGHRNHLVLKTSTSSPMVGSSLSRAYLFRRMGISSGPMRNPRLADFDVPFLLECLSDGTWSEELPFCTPIPCWKPPRIKHGRALLGPSQISFTPGSQVSYECDHGFRFSGRRDHVLCLNSGAWSEPKPTCSRVNCGQPPLIDNGLVELEGTLYNQTVLYFCDPGYQLIGPSSLTCRGSGSWIEPNEPSPTCHLIQCPEPPQISNGRVLRSGLSFGDMALYSCGNDIFVMRGKPELTCQQNGSWSPEPPTCLVPSCFSLPSLRQQGSSYGVAQVFQMVLDQVDNEGPWEAGEEIVLKCKRGFRTRANNRPSLKCQTDGTWSRLTKDPCIPELCALGPKPIGSNLNVEFDWTAEQSLSMRMIDQLKTDMSSRKKELDSFSLSNVPISPTLEAESEKSEFVESYRHHRHPDEFSSINPRGSRGQKTSQPQHSHSSLIGEDRGTGSNLISSGLQANFLHHQRADLVEEAVDEYSESKPWPGNHRMSLVESHQVTFHPVGTRLKLSCPVGFELFHKDWSIFDCEAEDTWNTTNRIHILSEQKCIPIE